MMTPRQRTGSFKSPTGAGWQRLLNLPRGARAGVHIHLLGIGGSGLSAIAVLLNEMGYTVSGSDQGTNEATADLARRGITVYAGHRAENVAGADLVLCSSAVPMDNPEVQAAQAAGLPVVKRFDFLGPLMRPYHGVAVAGTHGKTTTTAMLALVLWRAGSDPSFIIGGRLPELGLAGSAARAGSGPFVIEADEYDRMFLGLPAKTAIVNNVEWDHVDCYPTPEAFAGAFREFVGHVPAGGQVFLCADDPGALTLHDAAGEGVMVETFGTSEEAIWQGTELSLNGRGGTDATVLRRGEPVARLSLAVPGTHNVRNALAALAAAAGLGIAPDRAAAILNEYHGTGRRFEITGEAGGVTVIDDYGHHPTEVAATLAAARQRYPGHRIWAVFQPHTYTRFRALLDGFTHSFSDADVVLLLDIYAARERDDLGMNSRQLLERLDHPDAHYVGSIGAAADWLLAGVAPGDIVVTLSAGDGNRAGQLLLEELRKREQHSQPGGTGNGNEHHIVTACHSSPAERAHRAFVAEAEALGVPVIAFEPMCRHTTFRIGGPAELYAQAGDVERLAALTQLAAHHDIPMTILGGGSNVLIGDAGISGLVIGNVARSVQVQADSLPAGDGPQVVTDSGLSLAGLARWAMREGWSGLEWAVSVPGTVGGAIIGNAGAYGGQIADILAWALVAWPGGRREVLVPDDLQFAYRSSSIKQDLASGGQVPTLLQAGFRLTPGDPARMAEQADAFLSSRRATQPIEPSAGSIFRNPPDDYAGRLIEVAGLKGHQVGGAQVSPRHANFIVNTGNARAADVAALIALIQNRVFEQFGVRLVPEIVFLGYRQFEP